MLRNQIHSYCKLDLWSRSIQWLNDHNTLHIKIYTKHARIGKLCIKIIWSLGSDQSRTWSGIQKPYTYPSHVWNHLMHSHKHSTHCNWHNTTRSTRIEEESTNIEDVRSPIEIMLDQPDKISMYTIYRSLYTDLNST